MKWDTRANNATPGSSYFTQEDLKPDLGNWLGHGCRGTVSITSNWTGVDCWNEWKWGTARPCGVPTKAELEAYKNLNVKGKDGDTLGAY